MSQLTPKNYSTSNGCVKPAIKSFSAAKLSERTKRVSVRLFWALQGSILLSVSRLHSIICSTAYKDFTEAINLSSLDNLDTTEVADM
jgi:hypothetical protein